MALFIRPAPPEIFFEIREFANFDSGSGPLPHPASQRNGMLWEAGWGSGLVPNDPKTALGGISDQTVRLSRCRKFGVVHVEKAKARLVPRVADT